jgi:hypothetical protein
MKCSPYTTMREQFYVEKMGETGIFRGKFATGLPDTFENTSGSTHGDTTHGTHGDRFSINSWG